MKTNLLTTSLVLIALSAVPVYAQTEREPGAAIPAGVDAASKVTDASDFVNRAAFSDIFEIRSSEVALEKTQNPDIRAFAEQMIADHKASAEKLAAAAQKDGITLDPPPEVDAKGAEMMDELNGANGETFDALYQRQQIEAHDEAIALFTSFAQDGETEALKAFAAETLPILEHHRQMLPEDVPAVN